MMKAEPWMKEAACRGMDPAIFHPHKGEYEREQEARSICARCPVADACLDYALRNRESMGIWGGLSERQRRELRRKSLSSEPCQQCGTLLEQREVTSGSPPRYCGDCRRAKHLATVRRSRAGALI